MKNFDMQIMAERIRALRQEKNVGQNKLAQDIQVSNASISYWENGKQQPSVEALYKIAVYFDVPADYILGLKDD